MLLTDYDISHILAVKLFKKSGCKSLFSVGCDINGYSEALHRTGKTDRRADCVKVCIRMTHKNNIAARFYKFSKC